MSSHVTEGLLQRLYEAYAAMDVAAIDALSSDDPVLHVPGTHPLSGVHRGKPAMWSYLGTVAELSGGHGGFQLHGVATDDAGHGVAMLTGTIREFVRPVVHIWRVEGDRLAEYWEANFDQDAEDKFWSSALPAGSRQS